MFSRVTRRLVPLLQAQLYNAQQSQKLFCLCTRVSSVNVQNVSKFTQVRHFIKDASRDESFGEDRVTVYSGMLSSQIRTVKWFSLTTSIMGIVAQPFIIKELSAMNSVPLLLAGCTFVGFFTFVTPLLLHFITKKYITQLDYNAKKGTYIASTVNFFCMLKETEFKPDDVKVPDVPGMFTSFIVKGKPMFLDARAFEDPTHYIKIMGYDKPMDFKMSAPPEAKKQDEDK